MQDFNGFNNGGTNNLVNMVMELSKKFDGKDPKELLHAIYKEGEKNKRNGSLTNKDLDNFQRVISPFVNEGQRKILNKLIEQLKKI